VFRRSRGMPQSPSGGGCMTAPISPWPSLMISMNALRSSVSDIARRTSGLSKGGASRFTSRLRGTFWRDQFADRLWRLVLDVLQLWDCDPEKDIVFDGEERQKPRRDVFDDRVLDAVEIGPARLPIVGVARHRDRLVGLEVDEFEWAGADRMLAHVAGRDMAGIDRRPAGREQREERGLRSLQMDDGLVIPVGGHLFHIGIPGFARIDAQLFLRVVHQEIEGASDVCGGEGLAVVPFDVLP